MSTHDMRVGAACLGLALFGAVAHAQQGHYGFGDAVFLYVVMDGLTSGSASCFRCFR